MPLYVVRQVQNVSSKVEAFMNRNLLSFSSATVPQAQIFTLGIASPGFLIQMANMANEVEGRIKGAVKYGDYGVMKDILSVVPADIIDAKPLLLVDTKGADKAEWAQYGMRAGEKKGHLVGSPNSEQLKQIMAHGTNEFIPTPAGSVNLCGYVAFFWLSRGVSTYIGIGGGDKGNYYHWVGSVDVKNAYEKETKKINEKKVKEENANYGMNVRLSEGGVRCDTAKNLEPIFQDPASFTATAPGFLFEYFPEMMDGDPAYAFDVFFDLYKFALGSNPEMVAERSSYIRRGSRILCNTQAGKMLQHMFFAIDLSRKCGGIIRFFKEGAQYKGFVIYTGADMMDKGKRRQPETAGDLTTSIQNLASHRRALGAIKVILEGLVTMGGKASQFDVDAAASNPRYLRNSIMMINASTIEESKDALKAEILKLRFNQQFWDITPENVSKFLRAMALSAEWEDEPLYVSLETMTSRSPILNYLAVFGPQAPSIFNGNTLRSIAAPDLEDPNLNMVNSQRALPYIPVYTRGIINASADWASVANSSSIKFFAAKKGSEGNFADRSKDSIIISGKEFHGFYELLRTWVHSGRGGKLKDTDKGKRKADMDVDAGSSKKKTRTSML